MKIKKIIGEEVLDSRGSPTVAATAILDDGSVGHAIVPSGASTGIYEAQELRDNDEKRYRGMGVLQAIRHVSTEISGFLVGKDAADQQTIDTKLIQLDGTMNKSRLGANAILAVSLAVAKGQAMSEKKELFEYLAKFNPGFDGVYIMPMPEMNVLNGAKHANWATDIQEYMLFPLSATTLQTAVQMNVEVYHALKKILHEKGHIITLGDEGGFAPCVKTNEEPFTLLTQAVTDAGYILGKDIAFGIDVAASEFFKDGKYRLSKEGRMVESDELIDWYEKMQNRYPIISFEDIFDQDDFQAFTSFTKKLGLKKQIVGDDLYATNIERFKKGIDMQATNAILIKLNQIGTLTETIQAILLAKKHNLQTIISHRSGETEDTFIADLAVAMGTGQIKAGAPARSERVAKYNRLMRIERMLGDKSSLYQFPYYI